MTPRFLAMPPGIRGTWVAGGLTAALILVWMTGDAAAIRRVRSDPEAMRLLRGASGAARQTPYEGTQFVTSWNPNGLTTSQVTVQHTPGDGTRLSQEMAGGGMAGSTYQSDAVAPGGGLTGFTPQMLTLLASNFSVVRARDGAKCGRRARVVEARRADGSAAGRFWIDHETGLMLHRELLDRAGRVLNVSGFNELRVRMPRRAMAAEPRLGAGGERTIPSLLQSAPAPWGGSLRERDLRALRDDGWSVPRSLPGGLALQDARRSGPPTAEGAAEGLPGGVLHLNYSDGLSVVSVFVQRGSLDESRFARWQRVKVKDRTVFRYEALQRWSVWAGRGYVYSVLADAPRDTTDTVVGALPHGNGGFWARMDRGFVRLRSWMNPFG